MEPIPGGDVRTVFKDGRWTNQLGELEFGVYAYRDRACAAGRAVAILAERSHVIHNADGTIMSVRQAGRARADLEDRRVRLDEAGDRRTRLRIESARPIVVALGYDFSLRVD